MNRRERRKAASQQRREPDKSESETDDRDIIIKVCPGRYFALIAFIYGKEDRDWLASVWRDRPEDPWHFNFRFRYYGPEGHHGDPWDGADKKSFYSVEIAPSSETEDEIVRKVRLVIDGLMETGFNDKLDFIEPKSSDPTYIMYLLSNRHWVHGRLVKEPS